MSIEQAIDALSLGEPVDEVTFEAIKATFTSSEAKACRYLGTMIYLWFCSREDHDALGVCAAMKDGDKYAARLIYDLKKLVALTEKPQ